LRFDTRADDRATIPDRRPRLQQVAQSGFDGSEVAACPLDFRSLSRNERARLEARWPSRPADRNDGADLTEGEAEALSLSHEREDTERIVFK
jgi:hypothetical protein